MAKHKNIGPENGALTTPMNTKNKEFKEFQLFLKNRADALDEKQRLELELFALQVKIEDYLNSSDEEVITVGEFLRLYIEKLELKQNKFAKYIGLNPTNFNKILSGNRKVNFELSFMLSQLFNLDPKTWILIQVKNEYLELKKSKAKYFQKYKLNDLMSA